MVVLRWQLMWKEEGGYVFLKRDSEEALPLASKTGTE